MKEKNDISNKSKIIDRQRAYRKPEQQHNDADDDTVFLLDKTS